MSHRCPNLCRRLHIYLGLTHRQPGWPQYTRRCSTHFTDTIGKGCTGNSHTAFTPKGFSLSVRSLGTVCQPNFPARPAQHATQKHRKTWGMSPGVLTSSQGHIAASRAVTGAQSARSVALNLGAKGRPLQTTVTPENILRCYIPDVELPSDVTLHQMVFGACDNFKDTVAVEDFLTGRKYTYTELKAAIIRVASALYRKGYRRGDVLLAVALNNVDFTVLMVACAAAGVCFSAANPAYTSAELARQLNQCGARGVVVSQPLVGVVEEALKNGDYNISIKDKFVFGEASGFQPFQELLEDDGKSLPDLDIDTRKDVCLLPFSSGTTGFPKGVMLTHHNVTANVVQQCSAVSTTPGDSMLGLMPLYHIYGMVVIQLCSLFGGSTLHLLPMFEPELLLRCMQEKKISVAHFVPPLLLFLARHPVVANYDISHLAQVVSAAAPLGEELHNAFLARHTGVEDLRQGYGLTELSPASNIDMTGTKGSIGHVLPNTLGKIVDTESGQALGAGQLGELCVKGPQVMLGYLNNKQATDEMISSDGWLHTGDIAYYNEEGVIFIKDRLKELIKYKGFQVAPAELESLLLSNPDVQDVAVIGVPDVAAGELPKAFVVKRPGSAVTEDQIAQFVEGQVSPMKKLRGGVQFVDEIPKNASGKILRRVLKDKFL